jgi:UDP:flavonoid glycosyltransferase YjiC (YdhE family)
MLQQTIEAEPSLGFYAVGNPDNYTSPVVRARQQDNSVRIAPFIPASAALANSAVLLTHGGHSTSCIALSLGKPLIGVGAFQAADAAMLRNVDLAGAGIYLTHSEGPLERMAAPDLGNDIDIFGHWHSDLDSGKLRQSIATVLEDPSYTEKAMQLGGELIALGGVRRALDIIERVG